MSSLINNLSAYQSRQNSPENESTLLADASDPSDISVITRIDYNLRFTKQAVLVISDSSEQYSQLISQYLVSLSNTSPANQNVQFNVAYLSASSKLNDLQIRCRLVEQLFVNSLFDPEQSLAVSVIKFAKQSGDAISIVIEHAHTLSLQIKYELCQLVNQAKKHNIIVNVVMFGLIEAAEQLSANKSLFKNKMAIIDAETGQIINLNDTKVKPKRLKVSASKTKKILLISMLIGISVSVFWLYGFIQNKNDVLVPTNKVLSETSTTNPISRSVNKGVKGEIQSKSTVDGSIQRVEATGVEISAAILSEPKINETRAAAQATDVINALFVGTDRLEKKSEVDEKEAKVVFSEKSEKKISDIPEVTSTRGDKINGHYYHNQAVVNEQGYIIQIAGFYDQRLWARFITDNQKQTLFSYQRKLNQKTYYVVTSSVYPTKEAAQQALLLLPKNIIDRKPWLKSISSVINEINTFKG